MTKLVSWMKDRGGNKLRAGATQHSDPLRIRAVDLLPIYRRIGLSVCGGNDQEMHMKGLLILAFTLVASNAFADDCITTATGSPFAGPVEVPPRSIRRPAR